MQSIKKFEYFLRKANNGKYLVVERSMNMRLYPGYWNGISGFLDDNRSLEEKITDEIKEELGIERHVHASQYPKSRKEREA